MFELWCSHVYEYIVICFICAALKDEALSQCIAVMHMFGRQHNRCAYEAVMKMSPQPRCLESVVQTAYMYRLLLGACENAAVAMGLGE